jgi:TonB family protein
MRFSSTRFRMAFLAFVVSQGTLIAAIPSIGRQARSLDDISKRAQALTVSVTGEDGNGQPIAPGSGFMIRPGVIMTDYRVIKDAIKIRVREASHYEVDAVLVTVDERRAVAVMRIVSVVDRQSKLVLLRGESSTRFPFEYVMDGAPGEDVFVFSNFGGEGSLLPSRIDELRDVGHSRYFHLTGALSPESAGAPVLNAQGFLVGMVVGTPNEGAGPCFAIQARTIAGCGLDGFGATPVEGKLENGAVLRRIEPIDVPAGVRRETGGTTGGGAATTDGSSPDIIRKSGGVLQGSAIRRAQPFYPPLAKAARVSGNVVVEVTVDETGDVMAARAVSGHPLMKDCAVAAARAWKFKPTELSGTPVKVIGTITFNFTLEDGSQPIVGGLPPTGEPGLGTVGVVPTRVDSRPVALNRVRPEYTEEARANKTQGRIRARVLVGADGVIREIRLIDSLPDGLNQAAMNALKKVTFKPATLGGENVANWVVMEVEFNLR